MDRPYEEEQNSIEASLEEFEQELFTSREEKFIFCQSQEKQIRKELSEDRTSMDRLKESLPKEAPSLGSPEHEIYTRIQEQLELLKTQIAEKNTELMRVLKNLDSLSSE